MGEILKTKFQNELEQLQNETIRQNTEELLLDLDDAVVLVPSSKSGRYHPAHDQGEGGVIRHCKAVARAAKCAMSSFPELDEEFFVAAFVHDLRKNGVADDDHPIRIAEDCRKHGLNTAADLVSSHMGRWCKGRHPECMNPLPETFAQKILHLCDNIMSKQFIEVRFDENDNVIEGRSQRPFKLII